MTREFIIWNRVLLRMEKILVIIIIGKNSIEMLLSQANWHVLDTEQCSACLFFFTYIMGNPYLVPYK